MQEQKIVKKAGREGVGESLTDNLKVIAVGDLELWREVYNSVPFHRDVHFTDLDALVAVDLDRFRPDLIVSPIVTPRFDCLDVAYALHRHGFSGPFRALSRGLPNPGMIEREVSQLCPGLNFEITEILDDIPTLLRVAQSIDGKM